MTHERCVAMGAGSSARKEDDMVSYYAFFVFGPDGIRVEVCPGLPRPEAVDAGSGRESHDWSPELTLLA
jgi:hypothetical protein